jgi:hypothetical protein
MKLDLILPKELLFWPWELQGVAFKPHQPGPSTGLSRDTN